MLKTKVGASRTLISSISNPRTNRRPLLEDAGSIRFYFEAYHERLGQFG